jgi:hypothetical protein
LIFNNTCRRKGEDSLVNYCENDFIGSYYKRERTLILKGDEEATSLEEPKTSYPADKYTRNIY